MATNTKNFNFKKPDESDFYSIQDQNGNWDLADEELQKLNEPAFEDYTTGTSVPPAATALEALKSKIKLPVWMSNVVAFCKGCCTLAMIVNNCVSSDADKPLAAAQGKVLQDQLTKLYSDLQSDWIPLKPYLVNSWEDNGASLYSKIGNCYLIKLSVRYGNYETDLDICRNLPFSGTGVCTNCFYSSSEVGNAIQVSGNRLFIVQTPTVKMDTIFANFIVGPGV